MTTFRFLTALLARRVASAREAQRVSLEMTCDFVCALPIMFNGCEAWVDDSGAIAKASLRWKLGNETKVDLLRILTRLPHAPACYARLPALTNILSKHYIMPDVASIDEVEWARVVAVVASELARFAEERPTKAAILLSRMLLNAVNVIVTSRVKRAAARCTADASAPSATSVEGLLRCSTRLMSLLADRVPRALMNAEGAASPAGDDAAEEHCLELERAWCSRLERLGKGWKYVRVLRVISDLLVLEYLCRREDYPATFMQPERAHYISVFTRLLQSMPLVRDADRLLTARPPLLREWQLIFRLTVSNEPSWRALGWRCLEAAIRADPRHSPLYRNDRNDRVKVLSYLCSELVFRAGSASLPRLFITVLPFFFDDDGLVLSSELGLLSDKTRARLADIGKMVAISLVDSTATQFSLTASQLSRFVVLLNFTCGSYLQDDRAVPGKRATANTAAKGEHAQLSQWRQESMRPDMLHCVGCTCVCILRSRRPGSWETLLPERRAYATQTLRELAIILAGAPQLTAAATSEHADGKRTFSVEQTAMRLTLWGDAIYSLFAFLFSIVVDTDASTMMRAEAVALLCRVIDAIAVIVPAPKLAEGDSSHAFASLALKQLTRVADEYIHGGGKDTKSWLPDPALRDALRRSVECLVNACLRQAKTLLQQQQDYVAARRGAAASHDDMPPSHTTDTVVAQRAVKTCVRLLYQYVLRSTQLIRDFDLHADKLPSEAVMRDLFIGALDVLGSDNDEAVGKVTVGIVGLVCSICRLGYYAHGDVAAALTAAVRRQCKDSVLRSLRDDMRCTVLTNVGKLYSLLAARFPYSRECRSLGKQCLVLATRLALPRLSYVGHDRADAARQGDADPYHYMLPSLMMRLCSDVVVAPIRGAPMDSYIEIMESFIRRHHPRPPIQRRLGPNEQLSLDELDALETQMVRLIGTPATFSAQSVILLGKQHNKLLRYNYLVFFTLRAVQALTAALVKMPSEARGARTRRYLNFYRTLCAIVPLNGNWFLPSIWHIIFMHTRHFRLFFSVCAVQDDVLRCTHVQATQHLLSYVRHRQNRGVWLLATRVDHQVVTTTASSPRLLSPKTLQLLVESIDTAVAVDLRAYLLRLTLESIQMSHATLATELRATEQLDLDVAPSREVRHLFNTVQCIAVKFARGREW